MAKRNAATRKTEAHGKIRWHRPEAKNTDITVVNDVVGHRAIIPTVKGGGNLIIWRNYKGDFVVETTRNPRTEMDFTMGELEAVALIYAKLQEVK